MAIIRKNILYPHYTFSAIFLRTLANVHILGGRSYTYVCHYIIAVSSQVRVFIDAFMLTIIISNILFQRHIVCELFLVGFANTTHIRHSP
jgi:hypothetical protein